MEIQVKENNKTYTSPVKKTIRECFVCKEDSVLLFPDRSIDCMLLYPVCNRCLNSFLTVYPNIIRKIRNREINGNLDKQ